MNPGIRGCGDCSVLLFFSVCLSCSSGFFIESFLLFFIKECFEKAFIKKKIRKFGSTFSAAQFCLYPVKLRSGVLVWGKKRRSSRSWPEISLNLKRVRGQEEGPFCMPREWPGPIWTSPELLPFSTLCIRIEEKATFTFFSFTSAVNKIVIVASGYLPPVTLVV